MKALAFRWHRAVLLVSALAAAGAFGDEGAPRPGAKRPAEAFRDAPRVKVPLPKEVTARPKPTTPVLVRLPDRRRIPFADWLKLFGGAYDGASEGPTKTKPYDGVSGDGKASAAEGTLEVVASSESRFGKYEEETATVFWDFTYDGSDIIDVDLLAAIPYHKPISVTGPDSEISGGGGTGIISTYLGAEDRSNGVVSETIIYDSYTSGSGLFPVTRVKTADPRLTTRLHPGRSYRFYVEAFASAESWRGNDNLYGFAQAMDQITVESLMLYPTNGPRIEVTVEAQFPSAYDTYDLHERLLAKAVKKAYFPVVGEVHVSMGGQYAVKDSWIRITLRGGGRLTLLRPDLAEKAGFEVSQTGENTIQMVPPPSVNPMGMTEFHVPVLIDSEVDPTVWKLGPGSTFLTPLKRLWARLDSRLPEKPAIVLPNSKLVNLMDLGYWYIVMPAEEAGVAFQKSPSKAAQPIPVLYAAPPGKKAAPPPVAGWKVREVPWVKLAPPSLRNSAAPLVAVNLAALADLGAALAAVPAPDGKAPAPAAHARTAPAKNAQVLRLVQSPGNRGFYLGKPWDQQALLNRLEEMFLRWLQTSGIAADDRAQLVIHVTDDGEVITGKSLLEELDEKAALAALAEALSEKQTDRKVLVIYKARDGELVTGEALLEDILAGTVKPPAAGAATLRVLKDGAEGADEMREIYLALPHLNLFGKQSALHVKGLAANGTFAKCTSEDEVGFTSYFDFIPRRVRDVRILAPHLRGLPGSVVPSESDRRATE